MPPTYPQNAPPTYPQNAPPRYPQNYPSIPDTPFIHKPAPPVFTGILIYSCVCKQNFSEPSNSRLNIPNTNGPAPEIPVSAAIKEKEYPEVPVESGPPPGPPILPSPPPTSPEYQEVFHYWL